MANIGAVEPGLLADDYVTQTQLQIAMFQQSQGPTEIEMAYARVKEEEVLLSALRDGFEKRDPAASLRALCCKSPLVIDKALVHQPEKDGLMWSSKVHYLDYLLAVSSETGLWAALPNVRQDHNFSVTIDLHRPRQRFRGKHGRLGFDPKGSMMYVGKCRNDDLWFALVSKDLIDGHCEDVPAGTCTGPTPLSTRHYRMIIDFLAGCLSTLPGKAFSHFNEGQVPVDAATVEWEKYTNVM